MGRIYFPSAAASLIGPHRRREREREITGRKTKDHTTTRVSTQITTAYLVRKAERVDRSEEQVESGRIGSEECGGRVGGVWWQLSRLFGRSKAKRDQLVGEHHGTRW